MSFDQIPITLRTPGAFVEVDSTVAQSNVGTFPFKALLIGQRTTAGTVAQLIVKSTTSALQAREEHGPGSISHLFAEAFIAENPLTSLDVASIDDLPGGVAAAGRLAFGGTIANPGTSIFYVSGTRILVACLTDLSTCATNLAAAINAVTGLPVTAAVGTPTSAVVVTAKNDGVAGNRIDLRINHLPGEELPPGLTMTISAMGIETAGSGDAVISDVFAAISGVHYDVICHAWPHDTANLDLMETEMAARADALVGQQGVVLLCHSGTHSALVAVGNARNDEFASMAGVESVPGWDIVRGASIAGQAARFLELDPVRPLTGRRKLRGFGPSDSAKFTDSERDLLLHDGMSTLRYDRGNKAEIERLVTMYQQTTGGSPDEAFLDVQTMFGLSFVRRSYVAFMERQYPNHKLAIDGTPIASGSPTVTPQIAKGEASGWYAGLVREGICEDLATFKAQSVFQISGTDPNRLEAFLAINFVNQLRVIAVKLQFKR